MKKGNDRVIATNKKAYHNYFVEETFEAGMSLLGTEVKSIRNGKVNLKEGFGRIKNGEVFLFNCHISPYSHGNIMNHEPLRDRKLLLHKREINRLIGKIQRQGYTLLPLKIYLKNGMIKLELGLGKGKKLHDKRDDMKQKESKRNIEKALKTSKQS